ncbi:MAG: carboxypeptidase regulatory-like domain-containing protein [Candidatus Norongarragalinales archaeon]
MAEGGKGVLDSLGEAYENFVSSLEEKGVPSPRTLVPVAAAVIIIAIALVLLPSLLNPTTTIEFKVLNSRGAPVAGADVTIYAGEKPFNSRSESDGTVVFDKVPQQAEYEVSVSALGYQPKKGVVENKGEVFLSGNTASQKKTLKIKVLGSDRSTPVGEASVVLSFDDGTKRSEDTDDWGDAIFDLSGVDKTIATVEVSKEGFKSKTKTVNVDDGTITIDLKETGEGKKSEALNGDFIVKVSGGEAEGVVVSLVDLYTQTPISKTKVGSDNQAVFARLAFGSRFAINAFDPEGRFETYAGQEMVFEENLQEEHIALIKKEGAEDELVITVKGKDGERIAGAEVKLYDKTTRTWYAEDSTDASGNVRIAVAGRTYYATAFKEGYLPGFAENARRGDAKTIELEKEGADNSAEASVLVKENGEPLPDAEVNFFKANGFPLGIPTVFTSADGSAVFNMPLILDGKNYKAYASASVGNKIGKSDLVDMAEGIEFVITVQAPPANVTLMAKNLLTNERISNALFSVTDAGESIINDCSSPCTITVPAQVEVKIIASAGNYMQTTTAPVSFEPGETKTVEVLMYPLSISKKNSLAFLGFFDNNGNNVVELQRAQEYDAKFMLALGEKGDAFAFFQAGESSDALSEPFELKGFKSALKPKTVFAGENAESVCSPEEKTQPEALKWVELDYTNQLGAGEIVLEIAVRPDAPARSEVKILHRAGGFIGANGIPFTSPQDDDLIMQLLSQSSKGRSVFCSAKTGVATARVHANPLTCKDGLCSRIILEREDGFKSSNNLVVPVGQQFKMNFDLFAPDESIDSVALEESPSFEIISGSAGEAHFAERTFAATGTEKTSGSITMRALRQTARAALRLKAGFASEKPPMTLEKSVEITGTNSFQISVSPQQAVLGESVRAQAIVLDSFSRPVTDAEVSVLNCEGSPRVLQETRTVLGRNAQGEGRDGKYEFRFTPQTVGKICFEARADGFETKTNEGIEVGAEDFLTLDKEKISFEGVASEQTPAAVEVKSALKGAKIKIQAGVNAECALLLSVVPAVKEKVEDSGQFNVRLNSFDAIEPTECSVTFIGEANPTTKATVILPVSISTSAGPPPEAQQCDPNACLTTSEAQSAGCSPRSGFACEDPAKSCFVCGSGLDGISNISLSVSNLKNDRRVYPLFLDFDPRFNEEFDLVWDQQINTRLNGLPQQYPQGGGMPYDAWATQQYGASPYYSPNYPFGIGQGYYSQYQYNPEFQNPIRTGVPPELLGSTYPFQQTGLFGYSQSQLAIPPQFMMQQGFGSICGGFAGVQCPPGFACDNSLGSAGRCVPTGGAYPGLQPGQPVVPPYCYNYVYNSQSAFNYQYSQVGFSAYTPGVPYGLPPQCQYPLVCQNPQACGYIAGGAQGLMSGGVPFECQYPQVCNNPSACRLFGGLGGQPQVQFKQVAQPFRLTVELTKAQLVVSAVYTGDEYFFAGGRPASARGFLIIRDSRGTEIKRIAITVQVGYSGSIPPQGGFGLPGGIPPAGVPPYGFPSRIPPECFALFYPQAYGAGQFALPQNMVVAFNAYTGKGQAEYSFDAPRIGKITCQTQTSVSDVSCSMTERKESVQTVQGSRTVNKTVAKQVAVLTAKASKARKDAEAQGKVSFVWSVQAQNKIEQDFVLKPDEFKPQKIQLLKFLQNQDSASFEVEVEKENCEFKGDVAKVTCNGTIKAETTGSKFGEGVLTIKSLNDNQVREIPVVVSNIVQNTFKIDSSGKGTNKITFNPKLDYAKEGAKALGIGIPEFLEGEGGKCYSVDAALENNEVKITADCTNLVKDNKLPDFVNYYVVKLELPENAGGRAYPIPFIISNKPVQFDFTKPVIISPTTAPKSSEVTVKVLYLMQDDPAFRVVEATGVSKDGKIKRILAKASGSEANALSFKMVNTEGSIAEVKASTRVNGKTVENTKKIGLTDEKAASAQGKPEEKQAASSTGGEEGSGGGVSTGSEGGGATAVEYGTCTVEAGKRTKETTKDSSRILNKGVSSGLKGQCGDVSQCTSSGGKAYSGFCSGSSNIQCCVGGKTGEATAGPTAQGILEAKIGTGRFENFKEKSDFGTIEDMNGRIKIPLSLIPEGDFGVVMSLYYTKNAGLYSAGDRAESAYVNYRRDKKTFYWKSPDGEKISESIKLVKTEGQELVFIDPAYELSRLIDEQGKWKDNGKPAESTYNAEFKIKKGDALNGQQIAYAKVAKPVTIHAAPQSGLCDEQEVSLYVPGHGTSVYSCKTKSGGSYEINLKGICDVNIATKPGIWHYDAGYNAFFEVKKDGTYRDCFADWQWVSEVAACAKGVNPWDGSGFKEDPLPVPAAETYCHGLKVSKVKWLVDRSGEKSGIAVKLLIED